MSAVFDQERIETAIHKGEINLKGQFMRGSNYTFLGTLKHGEVEIQVVYKPTQGEQPLWDFPTGTLAKREVVAYLVSEALGWRMVPPTVYRRHAPLGPGSVQQYIEHDPNYHYFNFEDDDRKRLRPVMLFDALINNADRKGSHILLDSSNRLWLIDHGLCFHAEEKLRTVIWDFAGETIPASLLEDLRSFLQRLKQDQALIADLRQYLSSIELFAMVNRGKMLIESGCFSHPPRDRRTYPWPPV